MAEPTEEMVRREIARARRIIQSDKHAEGLKGLSERLDKHFPDNSGKTDDTPPAPDPIPPKDNPKRKSLWWGTEVE